jgi:hypothetical protein
LRRASTLASRAAFSPYLPMESTFILSGPHPRRIHRWRVPAPRSGHLLTRSAEGMHLLRGRAASSLDQLSAWPWERADPAKGDRGVRKSADATRSA